MSKIDVIRNFFDEVWTNENAEVIKQVFVPDTDDSRTADGLRKEEKMSPEDFAMFHQALLQLIKEVVVTVEDYIENGDWVVSRCTLDAKDRKTGKPVHIIGSAWARVTEGKIREAHNYFDFLHLFEGLDLLPENTMQKCMEGKRVSLS